ncbi:MAG: hypothetical protein R3E89_15320 [Thiolinea sp.]
MKHANPSKQIKTLLSAVLLGSALTAGVASAEDPLKVGFIYVSPIGDAGWTYQHDLGARRLKRSLATRLRSNTSAKSVPEGASRARDP